ncbi:MAG: UDP-glucose 4-epimerase GalE [Cyanobacteria bacterium SIG27]|nr:UDP-glucose 4-epimerase GalE [Cyanobacteria bacterium SIG27]
MQTILITGGAGYIGSHYVLQLLQMRIFNVIVFDNLSTGHIETINTLKKHGDFVFIQGDLKNKNEIEEVFKKYKIDIVVHFAAYSQIEESSKEPEKYFENNVNGTINLLDSMVKNDVKKIVFSSSAAIYGEPKYLPIDESHPTNPISIYGKTKLLIENKLDEYDKLYNLKSIRLRYFNVIGANKDGIVGESHDPETHLVPNLLKAIINGTTFNLYGDDYNTKDGTSVRDYIDINDLITAHLFAMKQIHHHNETDFFNIGTNKAMSTKEVIEICQRITNKKINIEIKPKREGDPAILVANNRKAKNILDWSSRIDTEESIKNAYKFLLMHIDG